MLGNALACLSECLDERIFEAKRVLEQRIGKIGGVAFGATAEGRAVGGRRGKDQRELVLKRLDVAAGIARRHDDNAPLDGGLIKYCAQRLGSELLELQRRKLRRQTVIAPTVALEVDHHHVVVAIDGGTDLLQCRPQIGDRGHGLMQHRPRIIEQHDGSALGVEALVEEIAREIHVLAKHILPGIRCKSNEIKIGDSGSLVREVVQRLVEELLLRAQHRLRGRAREARVARRFFHRSLPPGHVRQQRWREPERSRQQDGGADRTQCVMRVLGFQAHRSGAPKPEHTPQEDHLVRAQRSAEPAGAAIEHNGAHHACKRQRPFARKNDDRQCERKRRLAENQRQQRRKKHQQSTVKSFAYQPVQHERGTRLAPQRIYREVEPRRKEKQH